jgi:phage repressor protein C with HTH and peptisase S24 domain
MPPLMASVADDIALVQELIEWSGEKAARIAAKIGAANTTINRFANGSATSRLHRDTMAKLREQYPAFPPFRANAEQYDDEYDLTYVDVTVLPSYAGMGGGGTGEGEREIAKLPRRLIEEELRGKPSDFELIDVRGDSMQPDFEHGDQILIDKRDRDPRQPGPFALFDGDGYVVKLVERIPQRRGWYRIFSANERYTPYEIEEQETTIMGRPVWFARRL